MMGKIDGSITKKRVCIIGAGAAGTACAWSLSKSGVAHVTLMDENEYLGGVATTSCVGKDNKNILINDGVQGGATSYANVLQLMKSCGCEEPKWLDVKVSFGKDKLNWTNHHDIDFDGNILDQHADEIARFGDVLKKFTRWEFIYIFVTIERALQWHGFSKGFSHHIVYPLVALFFGTGNQTRLVPAAVFARVFTDEKLKLYDYDPKYFLSKTPRMFAFPLLKNMYQVVCDDMMTTGNVELLCGHKAEKIKRNSTKGVEVHYSKKDSPSKISKFEFDYIVFACNTEVSKKLIGEANTSFMERWIFRNITYFDDVSVTHVDKSYMEQNYEMKQGRKTNDGHDSNDMYFVKTYQDAPHEIEMSFDLTAYQPSAINKKTGQRIYQTIFLNASSSFQRWTKNQIDEGSICLEKWWRQFGHTVQHFTKAVPFWRFVQGKKRTLYAGSYTAVNTHEIAVISGFAAAYRLGAPYPFENSKNELAVMQFDMYLSLIHGIRRRKS